MLTPIIAAFATAAGIIMDKFVLSYQKVGHRQFIVVLFLFLVILSAILYPFFGKIDPRAFAPGYLGILILMILIAVVHNILYYHGIEKEKIIEVELIIMLTPLSTILIASIFLQTERNLSVFAAGVIASLALIFSHFRRHHFTFNIFQKGLLLYLLLYPIEVVLIKNLLYVYSPIALYLIRTLGILSIIFLWYLYIAPLFKGEPKPSFAKWKPENYQWCFVIAALAVLQMGLIYYAYTDLGVVFTTIILTLAPILTYLAGIFILKEKLKKRMILAAAVILTCIIYANIAVGK